MKVGIILFCALPLFFNMSTLICLMEKLFAQKLFDDILGTQISKNKIFCDKDLKFGEYELNEELKINLK